MLRDAGARAEFRCRICDSVAVVMGRSDAGVSVTGFLGKVWLSVSDFDRRKQQELDRAIAAGNAEVLYRLEPELVPAWCPTCRASYCRAHWVTEVVWAVDHPGWYDATYGTCPDGHRRKLDD